MGSHFRLVEPTLGFPGMMVLLKVKVAPCRGSVSEKWKGQHGFGEARQGGEGLLGSDRPAEGKVRLQRENCQADCDAFTTQSGELLFTETPVFRCAISSAAKQKLALRSARES